MKNTTDINYYRKYIVRVLDDNRIVDADHQFYVTLTNMIYTIYPFNDHRSISDLSILTTHDAKNELQSGEMIMEIYDVVSDKERIDISPSVVRHKSKNYTVAFDCTPSRIKLNVDLDTSLSPQNAP